MKKIVATLLAAILMLSFAAFAETYTAPNEAFTFEYNAEAFEINEDFTDTESMVIASGINKDWGEYYVKLHLGALGEEGFPTVDSLKEALGTAVEEVSVMDEWLGFTGVITYEFVDEDGYTESIFLVPLADAEGNITDELTVTIGTSALEDEENGMARSDMISELVDTLQVKAN